MVQHRILQTVPLRSSMYGDCTVRFLRGFAILLLSTRGIRSSARPSLPTADYLLRQTHPHKGFSLISTTNSNTQDHDQSVASEAPLLTAQEKPPSVRSLLALPVIRAICASQWMLGFLAACFNTGFVLMAYTPIEQGGLAMNVSCTSISSPWLPT